MDRLDKLFASNGILTRTECKKEVAKHSILINGVAAKSSSDKVDECDVVTYRGNVVNFSKYAYIMMNKPVGVVCSTEEKSDRTVLDLLPKEFLRPGLFPCGRLDKDTTGLVIITSDGDSAHRRLSPKSETEKTYSFTIADEITDGDILRIENGIELRDGYVTKKCKIVMSSGRTGEITIIEGKYHEIKRMFGAVGNKIIQLKRKTFAGIELDESLAPGECRYLTEDEKMKFCK